MKKKLIGKLTKLLVATTMLVSLTGCGSQNADATVNSSADNQNTSVESQSAAESQSSDAITQGTDEVITIYAATSASPRPFTYADENGNLVGHNIELIQAVFEKLPQYNLEIEITDFPSIFAGLDSGRYQLGINNFAMNDERKEKYIYTDPEMVNNYIAVTNKSVQIDEIKDLTELAGLNFVGSAGNDKTTVIENYNAEHPDQQINIVYTEADLVSELQSVESGQYDFLLIDGPMYYGYYEPEFNFDVNTYSLSNVKSATYSYFIVGKGQEQLAEDINKALAEVIEEGISTEISIRYLGQDYTPGIADK